MKCLRCLLYSVIGRAGPAICDPFRRHHAEIFVSMKPGLARVPGPGPASFFHIVGLFSLAAAALLLCPSRAQAQKLDLNSNGMSDIWEQIYGSAGLDPNAD